MCTKNVMAVNVLSKDVQNEKNFENKRKIFKNNRVNSDNYHFRSIEQASESR